ncbi:MAG: hypothetical protein SH848_20700 [Saprospiraceae bacterium]|nr:hypothetical protein [Saprospiraceae bacterium]MDZ4706362.1 hypothetical protein [Saprospiraceae bacterium]
MREFLFIVVIALLGYAFLAQKSSKPVLFISDEKIEVNFVKGMSKGELDDIQSKLLEKAIKLNYIHLEFEADRLTDISFDVKNSLNMGGSARTSFPFYAIRRFGFMFLQEAGDSSMVVGRF